ncbi:hypothetical protein HRR83_007849 [Exophiala dermatitidis]|uniref:Secreted peptide n=1 Tax=Exophiala dermatitidis TaxID=5970 RepID=A0AAN6ES64_EXODE|nr:hypothetical protein HRR74_007495 [Exophiala dermatitidis]KAJ4510155.1 hypothetical protein HRR73_006953 [Exophiala dermatitidis]KAJ4539161.1 hypothetical protein HRR77_006574 [Exophiala dermatitidis]KAJ4540560.1 hypothetical protein HRR76_003948 [Exophiala dermatitidis]KAJ4565647.1 hypothetical protein HRR81_007812 [Exophiala dermatitidis]
MVMLPLAVFAFTTIRSQLASTRSTTSFTRICLCIPANAPTHGYPSVSYSRRRCLLYTHVSMHMSTVSVTRVSTTLIVGLDAKFTSTILFCPLCAISVSFFSFSSSFFFSLWFSLTFTLNCPESSTASFVGS